MTHVIFGHHSHPSCVSLIYRNICTSLFCSVFSHLASGAFFQILSGPLFLSLTHSLHVLLSGPTSCIFFHAHTWTMFVCVLSAPVYIKTCVCVGSYSTNILKNVLSVLCPTVWECL